MVLGDGGGSGGGPWRRWAWTVLGGSVAWNGAGRWRRLTLRGACCAGRLQQLRSAFHARAGMIKGWRWSELLEWGGLARVLRA